MLLPATAGAERWFAPPQPRPDVAARLRASGRDPELLARLDAAQADWQAFVRPAMLDRLSPLMQVYAIATGPLLGMADSDLKAGIDALLARHVRIALVVQPVIVPAGPCGQTEGYEDIRNLAASAEKLKRLGVAPATIALDGGLWFGHFAQGGQNCRLSLEQTIAAVAVTVRTLRTAFPGATFGDIEPAVALARQPGWRDALRAYRRGLEQATGMALSYLQLDIDWANPEWRSAVPAQFAAARELGMAPGIILNGDATDGSDTEWLVHARENLDELEGGLALQPAIVSVSTWNRYPAHAISAGGEHGLDALLAYDAAAATRFRLAPSVRGVAGRLTGDDGRPLRGREVTLAWLDTEHPDPASIRGTVPAGAASAIVGLRINTECQCGGVNEVAIGRVTFTQEGPGIARRSTDVDLAWALKDAPRDQVQVGTAVVRVSATTAQRILANARPVAVTPGASFTLSAEVTDLRATAMFGAITVIWLKPDGVGLGRDNLVVRPSYRPAATATTDADGSFHFAGPAASRPFRLSAPAKAGFRGALYYEGADASLP